MPRRWVAGSRTVVRGLRGAEASGPNRFGKSLRSGTDRDAHMSTQTQSDPEMRETTTVDVKATGHVRTALDEHRFEFTFEGSTLREFLEAFLAEYDVADLLLAGTGDASTEGWARVPDLDSLPGRWVDNPEGEQTRPYARVLVNGRFNELLDGFDTELEDGDRVALVNPFMYCC